MDTPQRLTLESFKRGVDNATNSDAFSAVVPKGLAVEVKAVEGEDLVREFVASTGTVDRDGDTIDPGGWELQNFAKAGVFLWAHNRTLPPIGDPFATFPEGQKLTTRVRFPDQDFPHPMGKGFGHTVMRMYDERLMKGVSVGFLPIEWVFNEERGGFMPMDFKRQELIEISAEPVISNPDALSIARSKGIDTAPIVAWAETVRDDQTGLWIPEGAIEALLDQAAGDKTISIPAAPEPEADPDPATDPEPPDAADPVAAYAAATKAAENAEAKIVDTIVKAIDALTCRKGAGLVSVDNAERLILALSKASDLLVIGEIEIETPPEPQPEPPADGGGIGLSRAEMADFEAKATKAVNDALSKHTGRLPV